MIASVLKLTIGSVDRPQKLIEMRRLLNGPDPVEGRPERC
jgi:hypothetical protein